MVTTKIKLAGLTCIACKKVAEKRISAIFGVKNVAVDLDSGDTMINAEREIIISEIEKVLEDTNYQVVS